VNGTDWRAILASIAPSIGSLAGLLLFWWLRQELGWVGSGLILAGLIAVIIGGTSLHCYLRLHRGGMTRQEAFRNSLSWMRS
jgi:hypothetical protein